MRRSEVFAGTVNEDTTLEGMLSTLEAPQEALVVMDAGVATDDNIIWLRDRGYHYLVVSRERLRRFDLDLAETIESRSGQKVHLHSVLDEETGERRLYCHSEERAHKEAGIASRFAARFEGSLARLHEGLSRRRTDRLAEHRAGQ